ncbi:hypothetical protein JD276_13200 [Leucobacter sp. CSA1]|uniref:Uncharacterized protein n=1 Tax=Leucobacter chromiisoli TaxID=2796471 RepID=A0A934UW79_9MICO|nr:hypothetical protein [Leucobacter chromiisoli]MBK0419988.1 hypothetical protein [Leucobacter chromiisoli]
MNKAMKTAKKELTKLGCEVVRETRDLIAFRLLTGQDWVCSSRTQMHTVRSVVDRQRGHYRVQTGEYLAAFPEVTSAPRMEIGNYYAPPHFKDSTRLMLGQGLTRPEITTAILSPETVRINPATGRWIYCAGRIGVVIEPPEHGIYTLITILWSTDEEWEQNPRPEREKL